MQICHTKVDGFKTPARSYEGSDVEGSGLRFRVQSSGLRFEI